MKQEINSVLTAFAASLLVATMPAQAYELATHARMQYSAYLQSRLDKHHPTRAALALPQGSYTLLGKYYCDLSNEGVCRPRSAFDYDWNNDKFPVFEHSSMRPELLEQFPVGWMMRGAVREDDVSRTLNVLNVLGDPNPQDDPDSGLTALNRPCNHFLDPLNNKPLQSTFSTQLCLGDILADAGIWALGKRYGFSTPLTTSEDKSRRNHFTIDDARGAMWRALSPVRECGHVA